MTTTREPTNDDLNAAVRGLGMRRMNEEELRALHLSHATGDFKHLFASKVIAQAALDIGADKGFHIQDW